MKHLSLLLFALLIFVTACDDEPSIVTGCTDANALNYNSEATEDDSSCEYYTDQLVGNYTANSTCTTNPFGEEIQIYETDFSFVVTRRSYNQINMVGFASCSDTIVASVSESLSIVAPQGDCVDQVSGNYNEGTQTITYTHPTGFGDCEGTATKQ